MSGENAAVAAAKEQAEPGLRLPPCPMHGCDGSVHRATPFKYQQRRTFCWRHLTWLCARHG